MSAHPETEIEARVRVALIACVLMLLGVLLLRLLLPWLAIAAAVGLGYWLWQQASARKARRQVSLNQMFYRLLQTQRGRISAVDLAMQAQISGAEAKAYLDEQARAFSAQFEPTVQGDVLYVFTLGQFSAESDS